MDLAHNLPGDLLVVDLDGEGGWCVTRGAWIASSGEIQLDTRWTGFTMLLSGQGGHLGHAAGTGRLVVVGCYGGAEALTLGPG